MEKPRREFATEVLLDFIHSHKEVPKKTPTVHLFFRDGASYTDDYSELPRHNS